MSNGKAMIIHLIAGLIEKTLHKNEPNKFWKKH